MNGNTKKLAVSAFLVAMDVVFTRLLAINTPIMKIGLGFAAVAICAMQYGPLWAAMTAAIGDLVGALLFPTGAYFPGFTLTAACTGLIYGLFLHGRADSWRWPIAAALVNTAAVSYLANTAMICYITGNDFHTMLAARTLQAAVMIPVQIAVLEILTRSPAIKAMLKAGENEKAAR